MRVFDLTLKDLTQLFRDWRTAVFQVAMPLAFTLLFGFMFGGFHAGDGEYDPRLPVGFLDQSSGSLAPLLVDQLEDSEVIRMVFNEDASLDSLNRQVNDGELAGYILIPEEYGDDLLTGSLPQLKVIADIEAFSSISISSDVQVAANRLFSAVLTARLSMEAYEEQAAFADEAARQTYFDKAMNSALSAWEDPPIQTKNTHTGAIETEEDEEEATMDNAFIQSSPAMIAQFTIAGLLGAANIIVSEKKNRSLQRLLTTPISRWQILLGHYLAMFTIIFLQVFFLIAFGQLFLRLDYFSNWEATMVLTVAVALCMAALGLLIGALSKSEENTIVLSLVPMFILSGLGGAWVPLEFTSETVQFVGHFSPVAWIMDGFKDILNRGLGLEAVWLPALILLGFAVLFGALAVWRFKFE